MNEKKKTEKIFKDEPFFIVPSKVFELGLDPYELSALFYLCMRADNENHTCFPSVSSITMDCKMSDSKARKSIHSLEEKGVIKIKKQYLSTKKGFNRRASNLYTVLLLGKSSPPIQESPPPLTVNTYPHFDEQLPPVSQTEEINKTKPILTTSNTTKPTELSMSEAEAVLKERNNYLDLKRDCFEKLKKDYRIEEDYVLLIDRALEHLWHKEQAEYDGIKHKKSELQTLLASSLKPELLAYCVQSFENSKEPIRAPVSYLAKCILGVILHPENVYVKTSKEAPCHKRIENTNNSSFNLNDFFEAAINRTFNM